MVLTQWQGLSPEDTSWEPWPSLSKTYHLEDKVSFPAEGGVSSPITIDTSTTTKRQLTTKPKEMNQPNEEKQ
ncbi:hypothetical protein A2U01_0056242, partial [Trifolium medium]|nr:hypothetical protein [Trifolium medium]